MSKAFASTGDMEDKNISFTQLGEGLYAFTAEGDPNTGVIVGDDGVMVIDTQATPRMANQVIDYIRKVTDKPVTVSFTPVLIPTSRGILGRRRG